MPSPTSKPARRARSTFGRMPRPATTASAAISYSSRLLRGTGLQHGLIAAGLDLDHFLLRPNLNAFLAIIIVEERGQVGREHASADALLGKDHDDLPAVHGQRGGDFGADESAADDRESLLLLGQLAKGLVIVQGAEVEVRRSRRGQATGRAAGGQEQLAVGIDRALIVGDAISLADRAFRPCGRGRAWLLRPRLAPDGFQRAAFPQATSTTAGGRRAAATRR